MRAVGVLPAVRYLDWGITGMSTVATMAKKKSAKPKQAPEPGSRRVVFQMKGTEEWKEWLDGLSKRLRMPSSAVVDNALVMYAKAQGYEAEAPER
jgi:hypothetical protein